MSPAPAARAGWLAALEALGNRLPDPSTLFLLGTLLVLVASQLAVGCGWSATKTVSEEVRAPVIAADGAPLVDAATGAPVTIAVVDPATGRPLRERREVAVTPVTLLDRDGLYWVVSSLVDNFKLFPPLAIVLVGMLGIGLAERSGFLPALLRASLARVADRWLTPLVVFLGVNASLAVDAGYVVLPPIAAALYAAAGRPPLAGIAAAFAGVAGGFGANLFPTGLDPMLAGLSESGARLLDPDYRVAPTCNWWFAIASTFLVTGVGWLVTDAVVEPRLRAAGGAAPATARETPALSEHERRGLRAGLAALALVLAAIAAAIVLPSGPLHGDGERGPRWIAAIVPLLFVALAVPGLAHGVAARTIRSDRDAARLLGDTMASMGPYVVMAFFAAQFVACFGKSRLGELLAIGGGEALAHAALPTTLLVGAFVATSAAINLAIASMSAKYAFLAPVFVPLFMQLGVSPELVQAAYRVADSSTNVITPLNPYLVIVLVLAQRYEPRAGIGTIVALMLPYALAFLVAWTALLLAWTAFGLPLGPAGPLSYPLPG
ncbi:MAG: aminobenzoyl-glutamate transporter [Proteobacteria bacterium]|nr:MAG: aminobenzoyl-glutamate transporter [Pseudomonadota bacterium]